MHDVFDRDPSSPYVAYLEQSQRPVVCLIYVLPFLMLYHIGIWFMHLNKNSIANGADVMLAKFLNVIYYGALWFYNQVFPNHSTEDSAALWFLKMFGPLFSMFLLVFVLLLKQHLGNYPWRVKGKTLLLMLAESTVFAIPPFGLAWLVNHIFYLRADMSSVGSWFSGIVLSMGAGIYEEFLFRMILMGFLFWLFGNVFRFKGLPLFMFSVLGQAFLFSAFHYLPWADEEFRLGVFAFRTIAGVYFAYIYQERGFGIAAGSHAIYDIIAQTLNDFT